MSEIYLIKPLDKKYGSRRGRQREVCRACCKE
jgi:hypothetical protein